MARTQSFPEQEWTPGIYGPIVLDNFHPQTKALVATFTRVNWPGTNQDIVAEVTLLWGDGSGGRQPLSGGVKLARDGSVMLEQRVTFGIPKEGDGSGGASVIKQLTAQGTFEVFQTLRSAVTIEVIT